MLVSHRRRIILIGAASTFLLFSYFVISFLWHIDKPRIVARAVSPDGVEMCIVQECNWDGEPFTTRFVFHKPGTNWGWFYYDHEDWYWRTGRVVLDTNSKTARFYRKGKPAVTFKWDTETYTLHRWNRTLEGAQSYMPAGWSPTAKEP